jgi:DNA-binding winged helix-turn-helix (wHTH) protein
MGVASKSEPSAGEVRPLRLRFDAFELDEADARLSQDGRALAMPPKAFAVLCALARQPGQLVTKNALLDQVWGHRHVSESVLKTIVSALRAALSDDPKQPRYIETVSRRGYRFIAAVSLVAAWSRPAPSIFADEPGADAPQMIGRRDALSRLGAAWANAAAGRTQIVWVAGEAGIGKTTLIDNFVTELGPERYAHGQCIEQHGAGEPYLPVLEALAAICRSDQTLVALMRAVAPTWLLQMPWLSSDAEREVLRRELAGGSQDRMLREMGELLEQYTRDLPLLLVTEDLHWSDAASVHLIDHLARRRGSARFMWLASFRLAEVISEEHPLKALRHELRLHRDPARAIFGGRACAVHCRSRPAIQILGILRPRAARAHRGPSPVRDQRGRRPGRSASVGRCRHGSGRRAAGRVARSARKPRGCDRKAHRPAVA